MTEQQTPVMTPPAAPPAAPTGPKKKRKGRGKTIAGILIVAAIAIALVVLVWYFVFREDGSKGEVMTDFVTRGSIQSMVEGSGTTKAKDSATVTPGSGTILELFVQEGDQVTAGQQLYRMDDTTARDAVTEAQKSVDNCNKELQAVYDKIAELSITAPHAGNLREVADLKVGDTVNEGDTIATLVNDTKLRLSLYYSYAYEGDIKVGQTAQISIPAIMAPVTGKVEQINKVRFVSNITDIDDKLITKANEEGVSMQEVARRYEAEFLKDCEGLNVLPPTVRPRATEHIDEILSIVADIIEKGYGYVAKNGDVYFRARKFKEYGKLSHLNLDELESGNRSLRHTMEDDLKEDPADFAVWKAAKPGEPYWDSPYGPGRPGWHIECSAMARKHLGETIDIHAGGEDLIFPHHENEIAQSECANGCEFAHYWMHNAFLNIDNRKMSKSAGNFFTVREIAQKYGYEPIRYFMLTAQYRSPLNYTVELIEACRSALERLYTCRENLDFALQNAKGESEALTVKARFAREKFCEAMDDDLNTPDALAAIFDFVRDANTLASDASKGALEEAAAVFDELTGVLGIVQHREKEAVPADVMALVAARAEAKKAKDWARADALRAEIGEKGYAVEDTPQGPKVLKK